MTLFTNMVPPDTMRYCTTCDKETVWGYVPMAGHSRCRTCGCNLHSGKYRTLDPEDFKKTKTNTDDKDKKIRELEEYIRVLKRRLNGQKKNTKGLLNKLKRERTAPK
jgi:hypothetical protein